jgi:hypothetical protein
MDLVLSALALQVQFDLLSISLGARRVGARPKLTIVREFS